MKEKRILHALEAVNEKYINEAVPAQQKSGKAIWGKRLAVAACVFLILGGLFALSPARKPPAVLSAELPQISVPKYEGGGMGFEGLMYYGADELENGNPWREDMALDTLPVYRNGSFDPSGAGTPIGISEKELREELVNAAQGLGLEILDTEVGTMAMEKGDAAILPGDTVCKIRAITDSGSLIAYADGSLVYDLPEKYALPEEYHFTHSDTSDSEAEDVMIYLMETYASFLNYSYPQILLQGDYSFDGEYTRRYLVYDAGSDAVESILNYCFRATVFAPDPYGNLMLICRYDGLRTAEKIGEYPLISVTEAREKLLDGRYQTSVPVSVPGEEYIAKAELVYRSGRLEETLLPYYRFYVELQDSDGWKMTQNNGLKTYGAYYVPAIQDAYISNLSTYDGHFN